MQIPHPILTTSTSAASLTPHHRTVLSSSVDTHRTEIPVTPSPRKLFETTSLTYKVGLSGWLFAYIQLVYSPSSDTVV